MDRHRALAWLLVAAVLCGCSQHVDKIAMDPARLVATSPAGQGKPLKLACAYRLQEVVDARSSGDRAGGLGNHMFVFEDAAHVVGAQLAAAGLATAGDGKLVRVRIVQLYLAQSHVTKIPVAVYEVTVAGQPAFLVRSQQATMNWNGTRNEAYAAYSRVLADANQQLLRRLNAGCEATG